MKYNLPTEFIPQNEREEINKKILFLVDNNKCEAEGITKQDIYEAYTGDGHLHNLNFNDYDNFHEYSEAKREIEKGQFYTAPLVLKYIAETLQLKDNDLIADITSGKGDFFNFCPNEKNCYSNEIDIKSYKVQKYLYPDINITNTDMRSYDVNVRFDYIFGNPPFSLKLNYNGIPTTSEIIYVHKAYDLLKTGGIFVLLVPKSFANDSFMDKSVIETLNKYFYFICQYELPASAFKHVGINKFSTKVIYFQKRSDVLDKAIAGDNCYTNPYPYKIEFVKGYTEYNKNSYEESNVLCIQNLLKPFYELRDKYKSKLITETKSKIDDTFEYDVQKILYHIKENPKINKKYSNCKDYLNSFYTQEQPLNMSVEEWNKTKITHKKVLAYLNRILKSQNKKYEKDIIIPVYNKEKFYLKAYSKKTKKELKEREQNGEIISYDYIDTIINNIDFKYSTKNFKSYINKKHNGYVNQLQSFNEMSIDKTISEWLDNNTIYDYVNETEMILNDVQKEIVNKMLQKKYGYIQASQGSGKTLMGINMALYRLSNNHINNVLIVAPSIAINGTWTEVLKAYYIPFVQIKRLSDINLINKRDFILITYNMMIKYCKHIKKFIKINNNKIYTIIDEADGICNITGKTTKSVIAGTFKSRYKTCLSGTMTRNNIAEAYTQLEWLYGDSINFMCNCKALFSVSKDRADKGSLKTSINENINRPFPRYQKGLKLFKNCFNPEKVTVFGIEKQNQDIYNSAELKEIINKTIITKSFEEIVGKKIYDIHQILVPFNNDETNLYYKAVKHFQEMKYLFTSTGNPRKDKFLEILQQLNLLLDICRTPNTYKEYQTSEYPNKYKKVLEMIREFDNEYVAIGCRTLKEVEEYKKTINNEFHNRKLFVITGSISIQERKKIISELELSKNGILLSTQQSLSSSVNINFVNKCIITSSAWNYSTLSQYYFRFIRYNSIEHKDIYFVTYENSLECNLLGLLLAKEKLVRFMKNDEINDEELKEEFGVDFNLIEMLLTKEKDETGYTRINWGKTNL